MKSLLSLRSIIKLVNIISSICKWLCGIFLELWQHFTVWAVPFLTPFYYLFIYFGLCWVFVACTGFLLFAVSGGYSLQSWASHCGDFFYCWAWPLEDGLGSCGTWVYLLRGMWNLPRLGIEPCPLNWQVNSLPLDHQGRLELFFNLLFPHNLSLLTQ